MSDLTNDVDQQGEERLFITLLCLGTIGGVSHDAVLPASAMFAMALRGARGFEVVFAVPVASRRVLVWVAAASLRGAASVIIAVSDRCAVARAKRAMAKPVSATPAAPKRQFCFAERTTI